MDALKLIESRMQQINVQRDELCNDPEIKKYLTSVDEWLGKVENRQMNVHEKRNVAQALRNAIDQQVAIHGSRLYEATTADNISFLGIQLPIIAALLPTLVMNEVAVTQTIDRRSAAVFYLDVRAGQSKGGITGTNTIGESTGAGTGAGDKLLSAKTGANSTKTGRLYAIDYVDGELVRTGASTGAITHTCDYAPGLVRLQEAVLEHWDHETGDRTVIATVPVANATSALGTFAITAAGTALSVTVSGCTLTSAGAFAGTVAGSGFGSADTLRICYSYQYDRPQDAYGNKTGVPEVDVGITSDTVTARDFPLRAKFSLGSSLDAEKAHGINLEDELV